MSSRDKAAGWFFMLMCALMWLVIIYSFLEQATRPH